MSRYFENIKKQVKKTFLYEPKQTYDFTITESLTEHDKDLTYENENSKVNLDLNIKVYNSSKVNFEYLQVMYNALINTDIVFREFTINIKNKTYSAFIVYIEGMVDTRNVSDFILKPLMSTNNSVEVNQSQKIAVTQNISVKRNKKFSLEEQVFNTLMPQNSVKKFYTFNDVVNAINGGFTAVFIDTLGLSFCVEYRGFQKRPVSQPSNEIIIRGSQEAFVENVRVNTALLRQIVNNENLIIEEFNIGKITKTRTSICYMKNIANEDLVAEAKHRINNLDVDKIISSGQLEQLIQDDENIFIPQMIATERPDTAADYLLEGRIVIILNGSPYVLIAPAVIFDLLSSPEDLNINSFFSNFLRILRLFAFSITLLLPAFYVAVTYYHGELLPTELLFAIAASRESVPFPIILEIFVMELSFELIREAGLRVPSPIGPTLGIVGALILGEAAVSASIVSPILIIIVAITAISSFAIPNYPLTYTLRIFRFLYMFLAFFAGFLGIALGLFIHLTSVINLKSFGVPFISPYLPKTSTYKSTSFLLRPFWRREIRPDFLNTKRKYSEDKVSMKWKNKNLNT